MGLILPDADGPARRTARLPGPPGRLPRRTPGGTWPAASPGLRSARAGRLAWSN